MARIYVCDRCNKSLGAINSTTTKHHVRITREMDATSMFHNEIDLCDDCYELFEDYLADFIDYNHSNKEVKEWCNG